MANKETGELTPWPSDVRAPTNRIQPCCRPWHCLAKRGCMFSRFRVVRIHVCVASPIIVTAASIVTSPYRVHTGEVWPDQGEVHCGVFRARSEPIRRAACRKEAIATTSLRMKVVPRDYRGNEFTMTKLHETPIHRLFAP